VVVVDVVMAVLGMSDSDTWGCFHLPDSIFDSLSPF